MAAVNSSALTLPPLILPAASSIEIPNFLAKIVVSGILLLISCKASCPNNAPRLVTCPKTSAKFCKFAPETIDSLPKVSMSGMTCCAVRPYPSKVEAAFEASGKAIGLPSTWLYSCPNTLFAASVDPVSDAIWACVVCNPPARSIKYFAPNVPPPITPAATIPNFFIVLATPPKP